VGAFFFLGIEFAFVNPLGEQVALLIIPTLNDTNSFCTPDISCHA